MADARASSPMLLRYTGRQKIDRDHAPDKLEIGMNRLVKNPVTGDLVSGGTLRHLQHLHKLPAIARAAALKAGTRE